MSSHARRRRRVGLGFVVHCTLGRQERIQSLSIHIGVERKIDNSKNFFDFFICLSVTQKYGVHQTAVKSKGKRLVCFRKVGAKL